jgi:hypothetical protein
MIRAIVSAALVVVMGAAPAAAELKYTMAVTARPAAAPAAPPTNPLLSMLGPILVGMLAPGGAVQARAIVGDAGARFEYDKAVALVPAGAAMIVRADGSVFVIQPAEKTYWRVTPPAGAAAAPIVKVDRQGAFETIAGVRSERAAIHIQVALPLPADAALPGLPSEVAIAGDAWLADQYKKYAALASAFGAMLGAPAARPLASAGFPMRAILRSELFGAQEIETLVTSIEEVDGVPAGTFDVPDGFTEVDPPRPGLPLPLPR